MGDEMLGFGVLLSATLLAGHFAHLLGLSRRAGYLVAGVLLGPSFASLAGLPSLLSASAVSSASVIVHFAVAVLLFRIGGQVELRATCARPKHLLLHGVLEVFPSVTLVAIATWLAGAPLALAMLLGLLAAEASRRGSVLPDDRPRALAHALTNLFVIVAFEVVRRSCGVPTEPSTLRYLAISVVVGGFVGIVLTLWLEQTDQASERRAVVLAFLLLVVGVTHLLGTSSLLAAAIVGMVLVNASGEGPKTMSSLGDFERFFHAPLFALAGASLRLEHFPAVALLGAAYGGARICAKACTAAVLSDRMGTGARAGWLASVSPPAVLAIGFAFETAGTWPDSGQHFAVLALASVVLFEIVASALDRRSRTEPIQPTT